MQTVPKEIFLTKGVGRSREKLASFEEALRDAKLARSIWSMFPAFFRRAASW